MFDISSIGDTLLSAGIQYFNEQVGGLISIDRPTTFNFLVEIEGVGCSGFRSATPPVHRLSAYRINECNEVEPKRIYEHGELGLLTLEKGMLWTTELEDWFYEHVHWIKGYSDYRRTISVIQLMRIPKNVPVLGGKSVEVRRHIYANCKPVEFTPPSYDALEEKKLSIEKITIRPGYLVSYTNAGPFLGSLLNSLMVR